MSELGAELGLARRTVRNLVLEAIELGQMSEIMKAFPAKPGEYFVADPKEGREIVGLVDEIKSTQRPSWG